MNSNFFVMLGACHCLNVKNILTDELLLGLKQAVQLNRSHHLTAPVKELHQHNALVFQILIKFVVLFLQRSHFVISHYLLVLL